MMGEGRIWEEEAGVIVMRVSGGFYDGQWHVWRLGRVLMSQDRWIAMMYNYAMNMPRF